MANNPFEEFTIKPVGFKTKTTNSALSALSTQTPTMTKQPSVGLPNRLKTPMAKLGAPVDTTTETTSPTKSSPAAGQTATGSGTNTPNAYGQQTQTPTPTGTQTQTGTQAGGETPTGTEFKADSYYSNLMGANNPLTIRLPGGRYARDPQGDQKLQELIAWDNQFITNLPAGYTASNRSQWEQAIQEEMQNFAGELQQYPDQYDKIFKNHQTRMGWIRQEFVTQHGADETYGSNIDWLVNNFQTMWNNESVVKPFESEWTNLFKSAFGDLTDFGSSTDFLQSFMKNFGLNDIVTGQVNWGDYGFENYTPEALNKFLEDGSNIPGFEWSEGDPNVSDEQSFLKFIMNEAKTIRDKVGSFDWSQIFGEVGPEMGERMKAAMSLINNPGLTKQERDAIIKRNMATVTKDAEAQKREYDLQVGTQLAGQSTKSAHFRRLVDRDLMMARAQVEGDLTELDLTLRQQNFQKGMEELGSISRDKMDAMLSSMQIAGTREGQVLNFLAQVGQIAVGSKDTEYKHYENKLKMAQDFYLQNSERLLQEELGKAELDLKKFDLTTNEGLEKMRLAYQTALQNRGMNLEEAIANSNQLLETYKIGQSFAQMDISRLSTIAELAAKAQAGDREAYGLYQGMILEEQLKNRGMDIDQAQSLSQLMFGMWQTDKQTALTMWVEKYRADLQRELAQMEIDNQPSPWLQAAGQLAGGLANIIPLLKGTPGTGGGTITPPGDYNPPTEVFA